MNCERSCPNGQPIVHIPKCPSQYTFIRLQITESNSNHELCIYRPLIQIMGPFQKRVFQKRFFLSRHSHCPHPPHPMRPTPPPQGPGPGPGPNHMGWGGRDNGNVATKEFSFERLSFEMGLSSGLFMVSQCPSIVH